MNAKFYNHTNLEPVAFNIGIYKHPVLCIGEMVNQMLNMEEFMDRL